MKKKLILILILVGYFSFGVVFLCAQTSPKKVSNGIDSVVLFLNQRNIEKAERILDRLNSEVVNDTLNPVFKQDLEELKKLIALLNPIDSLAIDSSKSISLGQLRSSKELTFRASLYANAGINVPFGFNPTYFDSPNWIVNNQGVRIGGTRMANPDGVVRWPIRRDWWKFYEEFGWSAGGGVGFYIGNLGLGFGGAYRRIPSTYTIIFQPDSSEPLQRYRFKRTTNLVIWSIDLRFVFDPENKDLKKNLILYLRYSRGNIVKRKFLDIYEYDSPNISRLGNFADWGRPNRIAGNISYNQSNIPLKNGMFEIGLAGGYASINLFLIPGKGVNPSNRYVNNTYYYADYDYWAIGIGVGVALSSLQLSLK